jgi:probable HAF family extracellular repeat protein
LPHGPQSFAGDINDLNQICGWMGIDPYPRFGASPFIWHNGKTTTLPLPSYAAANSGTATALNNRGDACGYVFVTHPQTEFVERACAWIEGQCIDLGVLPGYDASIALDINDAREVVGYCTDGGPIMAFIWRDGVMTRLADLVPPGMLTPQIANAINNTGQIAGGAILPPPANDNVAFRLTPALPATPGDTDCSGTVDIDDLLEVIGHWDSAGPVGGRPADVNRDNRIDIEDLLLVLSNFTR